MERGRVNSFFVAGQGERGKAKALLLLFVTAGFLLALVGVVWFMPQLRLGQTGGHPRSGVFGREAKPAAEEARIEQASAAKGVPQSSFAVRDDLVASGIPVSGGLVPPGGVQRQVIRNAEVSLDVVSLDQALNAATQVAVAAGGFVAETWVSQGQEGPVPKEPVPVRPGGLFGRPDGSGAGRGAGVGDLPREGRLVLRIPAARFDEVMPRLRQLGRVSSERVFTQDVTAEYIDLEARVSNLEEQERRVRSLLSMAKTVDEVLRIESELARIRTEIDSHKGRLRFLADQVAYSTINLSLRETVRAAETVSPPAWQGVWEKAARAFIYVTNTLIAAAAGLVVILAGLVPVVLSLIVVLLVVALFYRLFRRKVKPPHLPGA